MSNAELYAGLIGFFLPLALAALNKQSYPSELKASLAFVAMILVAIGTSYFANDFVGMDPVRAFLWVMFAAVGSYKGILKPLGIIDVIEERVLIK